MAGRREALDLKGHGPDYVHDQRRNGSLIERTAEVV